MIVTRVATDPVFTTTWFTLLASFVAVNTLMYLTLAISKMLPKLHLSSFRKRRRERSQNRSIYPTVMEAPPHTDGRGDPQQ